MLVIFTRGFMKRILIALTASALMAANVSAASEAELMQAAQKVQELVTEAKRAGFSQEETLGLVAQSIETNALTGTTKLSVQQKRNLLYLGLGIATAAAVGGTLLAAHHYHWFGWGSDAKPAVDAKTVDTKTVGAKTVDAKTAEQTGLVTQQDGTRRSSRIAANDAKAKTSRSKKAK